MIKLIFERLKRMRDPIRYWRNKGVDIGDGCDIDPNVGFGSEPYLIKVGNYVRINSRVTFVTHDGGLWVLRNMYDELKDIDKFGTIEVGNNVHIGTGATIMPGVKIGNNCVIGLGAVVTRNVPDNSVAVGIPARVIESIEEYKDKGFSNFDHTKAMTDEEKKRFLKKKYAKG